jgi:sugar lactone lactonase YvrE
MLLAAAWAAPAPLALGFTPDNIADHVLGQPGFITGDEDHGGLSRGFSGPDGVAIDAHSGRLYVSDNGNNRVLSWPNAQTFANGQIPDLVLGQPDLTTNDLNHGGLSARSLFNPGAVAVDGHGNLLVADEFNNRVLEFTAPFTTYAPASLVLGQAVFTTGTFITVTATSLNIPAGVAVDAQGNVYVADAGNNRVVQFSAEGGLTNGQAGDLFFGQGSGTGNAANAGGVSAHALNGPQAVAVDDEGNLYVADSGNNRVLAFSSGFSSLDASRVFGQPSFSDNTPDISGINASGLASPYGVAVDGAENVYVSDGGNARLLEYNASSSPFNTADRFFGQATFNGGAVNAGGSTSDHGFDSPSEVAVDTAGNLYAADFSNNRMLKFDVPVPYAAPTLSRLSPARTPLGSSAVTLDVNGHNFMAGSVVRWNNVNRPTRYISSIQLQASLPASDVAANGPSVVKVFTPGPGGGTSLGQTLTLYARHAQDTTADAVFGQPDFGQADANNAAMDPASQLNGPTGLTIDRRSGRLFVADSKNNRVLSWPSAAGLANGQPADLVLGQTDLAGTAANMGLGQVNARGLDSPYGLALDGQGNLYVADYKNHRVLEFAAPLSSGMAADMVFGQASSFTTGLPNKTGISADTLNFPDAVVVDAAGNVYIADGNNYRVLEYDNPLTGDTTADRVFGQTSLITNTYNGLTPSAATLGLPGGLALDDQGSLYVADFFDCRVLVYFNPLTSDGAANRVLGQPSFVAHDPNTGGLSARSLYLPSNVAVDAANNVLVWDEVNSRILEYPAPITNHEAATRVFGQPSFITNTANYDGVSATSLSNGFGLALDAQENLFVADGGNSRVLEYARPLSPYRMLLALTRR